MHLQLPQQNHQVRRERLGKLPGQLEQLHRLVNPQHQVQLEQPHLLVKPQLEPQEPLVRQLAQPNLGQQARLRRLQQPLLGQLQLRDRPLRERHQELNPQQLVQGLPMPSQHHQHLDLQEQEPQSQPPLI